MRTCASWAHEHGTYMHLSPTPPLLRCVVFPTLLLGCLLGLFPPLEMAYSLFSTLSLSCPLLFSALSNKTCFCLTAYLLPISFLRGIYVECQGLNPGWPLAWQSPYLLYYLLLCFQYFFFFYFLLFKIIFFSVQIKFRTRFCLQRSEIVVVTVSEIIIVPFNKCYQIIAGFMRAKSRE